MKTIRIQIPGLVLVAAFIALTLSLGATSASASERTRHLHVRKDCTAYTGLAGSSCTITRSNIPAIPAGSKVFYDQAANNPEGLLDSNIVLDAGNGNRAVGRCTLDLVSGLALCLFFDGTGELAGFHARINGTPGIPPDLLYHWDGTYSFNDNVSEHDEK
jgi:hypothetical protein